MAALVADVAAFDSLVLAFAGLKMGKDVGHRPSAIGSEAAARSTGGDPSSNFAAELAAACAKTWQELGRPHLAQQTRERMLLAERGGPRDVLYPLFKGIIPSPPK